MAPPLLSRKTDSRGRPRKKTFGTGTITLLKLLAKLRTLRGTPLDVFGYSHDRRIERALIAEFEQRLEKALEQLTVDNASEMRDIIASYMDIRGYGPVKDTAIEDVRARIESH